MRVTKSSCPKAYLIIKFVLLPFVLLSIIVVFYAFIVIVIALLPLYLWPYSAVFGIRRWHMRVPQLYLDHFEQLNPELMTAMRTIASSKMLRPVVSQLKFWPTETHSSFFCFPGLGSFRHTTYKFTHAVSLFARLQAAGFERKVLWQFLAETVEAKVQISDEDKAEFRRVMNKVCRYNMIKTLNQVLGFLKFILVSLGEPKYDFLVPDSIPGTPIEIIEGQNQSLDWIFKKGACLVPVDHGAYNSLRNLVSSTPLWGGITSGDAEKGIGGYWQIVDLR